MTGHTLLLLQHGKSDWSAGVVDFNHRLKKRGERASDRIGRWSLDHGLVPDFVLSSPSNRAIATVRRGCEAMGQDSGTTHEQRDIYLAELEVLSKMTRSLPETEHRAMIVRHKPGLEELLAAFLTAAASPYDDSGRTPTFALSVLTLETVWVDIALQSAVLEHSILPRALSPKP